ncbi:MAG: nucleotidyltransferase domain-containing protein [Candidatus Saganbacteria bacterium]|nr:nucleotidyltransferase domain-containing protein [Candidatus Saganbacteria bacterium]
MDQKKLIERTVRKIAKGAKPLKIILFGSHAKGAGTKDSDLDFLIIKPSSLRRDQRDREIRKLLNDVIFPMDIFVYTPEEMEKYQQLPGSFVKKIMETGKVVYESK